MCYLRQNNITTNMVLVMKLETGDGIRDLNIIRQTFSWDNERMKTVQGLSKYQQHDGHPAHQISRNLDNLEPCGGNDHENNVYASSGVVNEHTFLAFSTIISWFTKITTHVQPETSHNFIFPP